MDLYVRLLKENNYKFDDLTIKNIVNDQQILRSIINYFYFSNYSKYNDKNINFFETQNNILNNIRDNDERIFYEKLFNYANLVVIPTNITSIKNKDIKNSLSLKYYTFLFDKVINKALRQDLIDTRTLEMVNEMINQININGIKENIILYRGFEKYMDFKIGDIIHSKGFESKTANIQVANDFAKNNGFIFLYIYNNNVPIYDLRLISFYDNESEYITLPNEVYEIVDEYNVFNNGEIYHVYECRHIGFDKLNPRINILNDYLLDKYEELLQLFVYYLQNGWNLILYDGGNNYTIFKDYKSLYNNTYEISDVTLSGNQIKHYNFMKMMQVMLELNDNKKYKVLLILNNNIINEDKIYHINKNKVKGIDILLKYFDTEDNIFDEDNNLIKVNILYESLYTAFVFIK